MFTCKQLGIRQKTAPTVDRIINRQAIATAYHVVILAMAGRRVHGTGAGLCGHMVTENNRHFTRIERVSEELSFQVTALSRGNHLGFLDTKTQHGVLEQTFGQ
jgi:hypothetical protein